MAKIGFIGTGNMAGALIKGWNNRADLDLYCLLSITAGIKSHA